MMILAVIARPPKVNSDIFRHRLSFEEQPPVLSDFSYDCASLDFRNVFIDVKWFSLAGGAYDDLSICFVDASGHGTRNARTFTGGRCCWGCKQLSEGKLLVFARGLTFFEWEVSLFCATFKCVVDFLGDIRYIKERSTATEMQQTFPRTAAGLRFRTKKPPSLELWRLFFYSLTIVQKSVQFTKLCSLLGKSRR